MTKNKIITIPLITFLIISALGLIVVGVTKNYMLKEVNLVQNEEQSEAGCGEKLEFSEFLGLTPEEMIRYDPSVQELDAFNALLEEWNNCIDMLSWQTYRNEEFGFEFKYPEVFFNSFKSGDKGIVLLGDIPGVQRMEVYYYEPLEGDITREISAIITWAGELRWSHLIRETENPKLYHFYKEKGRNINEDIIIVDDKTGNIVIFIIERTTDADLPVNQILSTFKFIE